MTENHTSKGRNQHLYLLFDDWRSGYSVRKVSLLRRSGKQRLLSGSSEEDSEHPKTLPVFMRVSAQRGLPQFFTSAFGTKIMVMHPRTPVHDYLVGIPVIDVVDQTSTFEPLRNVAGVPIYFPVSDDRLFALDCGTFKVLRKPEPEPSGKPMYWETLMEPPFEIWEVSSYGVQPDGCILVSTKGGETYMFDTEEYVWKPYGDWVFPFTGRGHYDSNLKGFVALSKDPETLGYLYCCTMDSTVTGDTGEELHPKPDLKCTKDTVYNKNPALGQHVSATLVHMHPGTFCLVECVSIDDNGSTEELIVEPKFMVLGPGQFDYLGGGPQDGRFRYCLKTFSLSIMNGSLELDHCKVRWYSLPPEARIGSIRKDPVAFWL